MLNLYPDYPILEFSEENRGGLNANRVNEKSGICEVVSILKVTRSMHKTIFATLLLVSLAPLVALGQAPGTAELAPSFLLRDFEKEEADFNQSLPEGAVVVS